MRPYNDSPTECAEAAQALLERARELLEMPTLHDAIWNNVGFHAAVVRLGEQGNRLPIGKEANLYIALVLAAADHAKAQGLFDAALDEAGV